jgi:predicted TIM-barrel fold metal-dependent hydrolase
LAELRNVRVKVSAAANYSHLPYPFTDMDEHIKRVIDSFGAERCFWGTDFTHSPNKGTYAQRKTHFTEHLDFLTASERALVMGDALLACLGWAKN